MSTHWQPVAVKVIREERVVELEVAGAPTLYDYQQKQFLPEVLTVTYHGNGKNFVEARGRAVRKDGKPGAAPRSVRYWDGHTSAPYGVDPEPAPDWVLDLVAEYDVTTKEDNQ